MPRARRRPSVTSQPDLAARRRKPRPNGQVTRSSDQKPRSTDYVLVEGVVVPRADVIREHLEEAASYEGPAQSGLVPHGTDLGSPTLRESGARQPSGPTAYQREVARMKAKLGDSTPQLRLYRFKRKKGCEAAATTVRTLTAKPRVEVRREEAEACWHLLVHWRANLDPSKLNRRIKASGGQQISHHQADEELRRAFELRRGAGSPALLGLTKPAAPPGAGRPARKARQR